MKFERIISILIISAIVIVAEVSCQKEFLCSNCARFNVLPVAYAGNDTTIIMPSDSAILRSAGSHDPDGTISAYHWTQLSGPDKGTVSDSTATQTRVSSLKKGLYVFRLTVTDNSRLTASDTVSITVSDINHPPLADAGPDRISFLPRDTLLLNGSASSDPDNNIASYKWQKIKGSPVSYIYHTDRVITNAYSISEGSYWFELTVTDALGLSSRDTVQIEVVPEEMIRARLMETDFRIRPRYYPAGAVAGDKILFAGGFEETGYSSRVEIFDTKTNTLSTASLSIPRMHIATLTYGDKVYFAGGITTGEKVTGRIDIYDTKTNTWSVAELSQARFFASAALAGNKLIFAGGCPDAVSESCVNIADIFDPLAKTWSTTKMVESGFALSSVVLDSKAYFAGGNNSCGRKGIDVFNASADSWSSMPLSEPRHYLITAAYGDNLYWSGGIGRDNKASATMEILHIISSNTSFQKMSGHVGGFKSKAFQFDQTILFFSSDGVNRIQFNHYETANGKSKEGRLNKDVNGAEIVIQNNVLYLAGGTVNGMLSDKIWTIDF